MPTIYKDGYEYGAGGGAADLTEVNEAIKTIYNLLTDSESGTAALKVLIDSTLQNETAIKNIVNSADYGNAKIKSVIDTINTNTAASQTAITNTTYGLNAIKTLLDTANSNASSAKSNASNANTNAKSAYTLLKNTTYGLSALNTDLDSIISSLGNDTYGLNALKTAIGNISGGSGGGGSYSSFKSYSMSRSGWTWHTTSTSTGPYGSVNYRGYYTRTLNTKITITGKGRFIVDTINKTDFNGFYVTVDGTKIALPVWLQNSGNKIDFGKSLVFECSSVEDHPNFTGTRYPSSGDMPQDGSTSARKPAATAFTGYLQM